MKLSWRLMLWGVLLLAVGFAAGALGPASRWRAALNKNITDNFHELYFYNGQRTWQNTHWLGTQALKCPLDLWIFQEIIYETKPDVIVETGTYKGGTALYLATICDLVGRGRVVSIDIGGQPNRPQHKRITYLLGNSAGEDMVAQVKSLIQPGEKVMATLDSDHSQHHVLNELRAYAPLVTRGNYLIVEDTAENGHPVLPRHGPGPMEAVEEFMRHNHDFVIDAGREKFFLTFNPKGYLKRVH